MVAYEKRKEWALCGNLPEVFRSPGNNGFRDTIKGAAIYAAPFCAGITLGCFSFRSPVTSWHGLSAEDQIM